MESKLGLIKGLIWILLTPLKCLNMESLMIETILLWFEYIVIFMDLKMANIKNHHWESNLDLLMGFFLALKYDLLIENACLFNWECTWNQNWY